MYRPSGMTVVTAGLGALALSGVIWSRDPKRVETRPQSVPVAPEARLDVGPGFLLHSGAWRAWPAPVEEGQPLTEPAAFAAPEAAAGMDDVALPPGSETPPGVPERQAAPPAARSVPIRTMTRQQSLPAPTPQAQPDSSASQAPAETDVAPPAPTPPPANGRMGLAGPEVEAMPSPARQAGQSVPAAHSTPRARGRDPEPEAAAPSAPKFGPAIFKQVEQNGF